MSTGEGNSVHPAAPLPDVERLKEIMPVEVAHGFQPDYTAEEWRKVLHVVADNNDAMCLGEEEHRQAYVTNESAAVRYLSARLSELLAAEAKAEKFDAINTPELVDFVTATTNEALHQRAVWGIEKDGDKTDADWFWLIGFLAGKALHNPAKEGMTPVEARLHRIVTVSAAAANWHAQTLGAYAVSALTRIHYLCRSCPRTFTNARDSNAHHDATGHHQTFRCPRCRFPLSGHSPGAYAECMGSYPERP